MVCVVPRPDQRISARTWPSAVDTWRSSWWLHAVRPGVAEDPDPEGPEVPVAGGGGDFRHLGQGNPCRRTGDERVDPGRGKGGRRASPADAGPVRIAGRTGPVRPRRKPLPHLRMPRFPLRFPLPEMPGRHGPGGCRDARQGLQLHRRPHQGPVRPSQAVCGRLRRSRRILPPGVRPARSRGDRLACGRHAGGSHRDAPGRRRRGTPLPSPGVPGGRRKAPKGPSHERGDDRRRGKYAVHEASRPHR